MDFAKLALRETHDGQVLEVALDAPKANILDATMMAELRAVLAAERGVAGRKALVLEAESETGGASKRGWYNLRFRCPKSS